MTCCTVDGAVDPVKPDARSPRRARARETRLRITKAASSLFCERGYTGTTIADIATAAGVAVQTVYFVFHTKVEVLNSAYSLAVMGEDDPAVPQQQEWYRQSMSEPEPAVAVGLMVEGLSEILRRVAPLDLAVRTAADGDPDAAAFLAQNESMRAEGYREMVSLLRRKRPLRKGLTEQRATDVMLVLASPGFYRALAVEHGWTHTAWVAWVSAVVTRELFEPAERR